MSHDPHELPFLIVHGAIVWKLVLAAAIAVVCAAVRLIRRRTSWLALAVLAVVTAAAGWKIEAALGDSWLQACSANRRHASRLERHGFVDAPADTHACELAAATPGSRDDAISTMLASLDDNPYRDAATVQRIYQLSSLVEGCTRLADRLLRDARYDDAAATAHRCGDRRTEHLALRYAGELDEAVAIAVPAQQIGDQQLVALPDAAEWILTDHWAEAAAAAAARAEAIGSGSHAPDEQAATDMTVLHYRCLAELLRHRSGDAAAAGRLHALAGGPHGGVCTPALAELATGDERRALLAQTDDDVLIKTQILRDQLRWAEGLPNTTLEQVSAEALLADPDDTTVMLVSPAAIWLAATAPPSSAPAIGVLRWSAVAQVFAGDLDRAAATASAAIAAAAAANQADAALAAERQQIAAELERLKQAAVRLAVSHDATLEAELSARLTALENRQGDLARREKAHLDPAERMAALYERNNARFASLLPALVALRTPETALAIDLAALEARVGSAAKWSFQFGPLWLRDGRLDPKLDDMHGRLGPLRDAAATGDGLALATVIENTDIADWTDSQVMAVLPRIKTGRDVVLRQLAWSPPPQRPLGRDRMFPWRHALQAATRRDLFRLAGDAELAAHWDASWRRFDHHLRDRRRLVALMLWQIGTRFD